jgi:hypothetical protein
MAFPLTQLFYYASFASLEATIVDPEQMSVATVISLCRGNKGQA